MMRPLRIGLTGGIASGKSAVADLFAAKGVPIIDTDVIARDIVEPGRPALREIEQAFGPGILDEEGRLRRRRLRDVVFRDDKRREELEAILHPRIREEAEARAAAAGGAYQVIVVPLLAESPMKAMMDRILVVDCSEETQLARLLRRDAESEVQARRMIAAQASREDRLAIADDVVDNDGTLEATAKQVDELHCKYLELARS
ncbi:MAG TPA: dephospho-CoA kinase [Woeseiaceae bacterium]|nr:dephospho-CoA kinase [Woeseiaceae bacterium]